MTQEMINGQKLEKDLDHGLAIGNILPDGSSNGRVK